MKKGPTVGLIDVENAPLLSYVFSLFDQNIGLNQIHKDWHFLSCAFKIRGEKKIYYMDQRNSKNIENDKALCQKMISWINKCDILVGHNIDRFDLRKINARCVIHGLKPPKPVRTIDTLKIARRKFNFTSNKLAYLAKTLCGLKKDDHKDFDGFELWSECLKGNIKAWRALKKYNEMDVITLEALLDKLLPWDAGMFSVYVGDHLCSCGSSNLQPQGHRYTASGKFKRFVCRDCGKWSVSSENELDKLQNGRLTR